MLRRLKTDFVSSVLILVSGTVVAQLVAYSLSPLISRLYSPEEMSYLSLFSRIVGFLAVLATARFELAFPLPKREEHAFSLYQLALRITGIAFVVISCVVFLLFFYPWSDPNSNFILALVPIGAVFLALNNQGMTWAIRTKDFRSISVSKVFLTLFNSITTIVLALFSFGYKGLLFGYLIGILSSSFLFIKPFFIAKKRNKAFSSKGREFVIAKQFAAFPKINLPHVLIELGKELFIAFYLLYTFEKDILGLYDFSYRMLRLPVSLIGVSISQVFFNKAAGMVNDGASIFPLVKKTILILFAISILPFTLLFFAGSDLFAFVFGEPWREAGSFSEIMSPWLMMNFLVSPISQIPLILKKQRSFFILSLFGTAIMVFTLLIGEIFPALNLTFHEILKVVSIGQFFFFAYVLGWTIWLTKKFDV
jgi:teichuronic acid exporter